MNKYSHVTTTTIRIQNYSITVTVSPYGPFVVNPIPHHQPLAITDLFSVPIILPLPKYHKNNVMQVIAF